MMGVGEVKGEGHVDGEGEGEDERDVERDDAGMMVSALAFVGKVLNRHTT